MPDGKVEYEVRADTSKLDGDLQNATRKIETESKNWENAGKGAAGSIETSMDALIRKCGKLGEAFGKFVIQFIEQGIELADNLKDIDGMVDLTFGTGSAQKIDKWAKTTASKFGLAEAAAKEYAARFGTLMKGAGLEGDIAADLSESLVQFSVDLAAALKTDTDTAYNAIKSALTGNGTALKKLTGLDMGANAVKNYAISRGQNDFASLNAADQMAMRYSMLLNFMNEAEYSGAFAASKGSSQHSLSTINATLENFQTNVGKPFSDAKDSLLAGAAQALDVIVNGAPEMAQNSEEAAAGIEYMTEKLKELQQVLGIGIGEYAQKYGFTQEAFAQSGMQGQMSYGEWAMQGLYNGLLNGQITDTGDQDAIVGMIDKLEPLKDAIDSVKKQIETLEIQLQFYENIETEKAEAAAAAEAQAVVDGFKNKYDALQEIIDAYVAEINRLNSVGGVQFYGGQIYTPHSAGLAYVPYDNYKASLHEGESVLTAEEAKVWRNFKYGNILQENSFNYDALGVTMRENVKAGGNVFLDGEIVGRVISAAQGNSYRAMERSGFQQ